MKKRKNLTIAITAILLWCAVWTVAGNVGNQQTENDSLVLKGSINKESYMLGEPVRAQFKFVNNGETTKTVPSDGVEVGTLKVFIADRENGEYKEYRGSGWGTEKGRPLDLKPGLTHEYSEVTILWNGKSTKLIHFSEDERREALRGRISTEYAFQVPGVYWIKGLSYVGTDFKPIESKPIRVEVKEPTGEDLEVWTQIKGNREIAYLLQKGAFDTDDESTKQELISTVDQILNEHPESVYSSYLRPNLEKFKADEIRRKEMLKKAMQPKNQE